ncbi:hypothetical protein Ahy_A10g048846 [Arachis hypogaea]|uniref:Uncharacterized protein n=1 Tax=Arachis hypogaea TaxID=3818 RepID=A0A445B618_ARAHY|nr:hypothetical protein Ahy_A10g048846 [Arachis hypogaea]
MASASPFSLLQHALDVASDIWCNKINVHSWLIALNAHTSICEKSPFSHAFYASAPSSTMDSSIEKGYIRSTTESPEIQAVVKDFDLNKKPFWKKDLDPVAHEKDLATLPVSDLVPLATSTLVIRADRSQLSLTDAAVPPACGRLL